MAWGDTQLHRQRVEAAFQEAQKAHEANRSDPTLAWKYAQASFDLADLASDSSERARIAKSAIAASRNVLSESSTNAPVLYYLALNLGQLAKTKTFGGLKLIKEMETR